MSIFKKFKKFYRASAENRIQFYVFLGFVILPVIGMTILYICVRIFWLP
jgi:hypothetical protein